MTEKLKVFIVFIVLFLMTPMMAIAGTDMMPSVDQLDSSSEFDWSEVMDAIIEVESNGNPKAKRGNSLGAMQITPILVAECNEILKSRKSKKRYKLSDRFSVAKSKEMFLLFQSKYNPKNNIERAIRTWNGGLHYSVSRTQRYFERVMRAMNK